MALTEEQRAALPASSRVISDTEISVFDKLPVDFSIVPSLPVLGFETDGEPVDDVYSAKIKVLNEAIQQIGTNSLLSFISAHLNFNLQAWVDINGIFLLLLVLANPFPLIYGCISDNYSSWFSDNMWPFV